MTFNCTRLSNCAWVELRQSSGTEQTISAGDILKFDSATKRSTGGDSVSYNNTTGVLSLSSSKRYWVQASISIERSSNNLYQIDWELSDGTALSASDGSFPAYNHINRLSTFPHINSSFVASLLIDNPSDSYRLKVTSCPSNSTFLESSHLFIMELST